MKFGRATALAVSVIIWTGAAFLARPADFGKPAAEMKLRILLRWDRTTAESEPVITTKLLSWNFAAGTG